MDHSTAIFFGIFAAYLAAQVGAEIAQRVKLPSVVGEIAAGCIIGPSVFGWITITEPLEVLGEIGAVLLLFSVGLETRARDLWKVGKTAFLVGVSGVILPFICGALWAHYSGYANAKSMFIGAAFVATSAGITARVLQELNVLGRIESRVILGAAVIDDILAMLLLGVVTSLQGGSGVHVAGLVAILLQALGFIALIIFIGTKYGEKSSRLLDAPINPLSPLTVSITCCLGLAAAASHLGLAAIIGAFLAGMVMAETKQRHTLEKQIQPIMALLVPFFFVVTGAKVDLSTLSSAGILIALLVVTVLAILSKLIGCGIGALSLGKKSALIVGIGMIPRGEVGIIVASLGLKANVFNPDVFSIIIGMSLITSIVAPIMLKPLFSGTPPTPDEGEQSNILINADSCGRG